MRSVIAKRLVQSKQTSPHGHATNECNIDAISKIRKDFLQAGIKNLKNNLVIQYFQHKGTIAILLLCVLIFRHQNLFE